jgi:hypothetical protein
VRRGASPSLALRAQCAQLQCSTTRSCSERVSALFFRPAVSKGGLSSCSVVFHSSGWERSGIYHSRPCSSQGTRVGARVSVRALRVVTCFVSRATLNSGLTRFPTLAHSLKPALLDLQPLPLSALHNKEFEAIYSSSLRTFNKIQTQVFQALYTSVAGYLVIIMGVQPYEGKEHRYIDYPVMDVLQ